MVLLLLALGLHWQLDAIVSHAKQHTLSCRQRREAVEAKLRLFNGAARSYNIALWTCVVDPFAEAASDSDSDTDSDATDDSAKHEPEEYWWGCGSEWEDMVMHRALLPLLDELPFQWNSWMASLAQDTDESEPELFDSEFESDSECLRLVKPVTLKRVNGTLFTNANVCEWGTGTKHYLFPRLGST
jgi:hypothetical protein